MASAKEPLKFLRRIDRAVLGKHEVHLSLDKYATHKTPDLKAWLEKHPRFKLHFTPTSASWLNLVKRFFAEITSKRIRRGSYTASTIWRAPFATVFCCTAQNQNLLNGPKTAGEILTRARRALNALYAIRGSG